MNVNLQTCDSRFKSETLYIRVTVVLKFLCQLCLKIILLCVSLDSM